MFFDIVGSSSQSNYTRKTNKKHSNLKGSSKITLFTDDMIIDVENPKDSTEKKLLELIYELSNYTLNNVNLIPLVTSKVLPKIVQS